MVYPAEWKLCPAVDFGSLWCGQRAWVRGAVSTFVFLPCALWKLSQLPKKILSRSFLSFDSLAFCRRGRLGLPSREAGLGSSLGDLYRKARTLELLDPCRAAWQMRRGSNR